MAGKADVAQAESQLRSARASALDASLSRSQYEHAIAVLVGQVPAGFAIAVVDAPLPTAQVPVVLPSTLLERRPDIAAAERRVAAATSAIGAAQAARFPVLGLSASAGFRRSDLADLLTVPSRYWSLGPSLAAAISMLERGSKKVAPSDKMFDMMLADYRKALASARTTLNRK